MRLRQAVKNSRWEKEAIAEILLQRTVESLQKPLLLPLLHTPLGIEVIDLSADVFGGLCVSKAGDTCSATAAYDSTDATTTADGVGSGNEESPLGKENPDEFDGSYSDQRGCVLHCSNALQTAPQASVGEQLWLLERTGILADSEDEVLGECCCEC